MARRWQSRPLPSWRYLRRRSPEAVGQILRRLDFTSDQPGKATGFVEDVRFDRPASDEQALKRAVIVLARGTRLDDSVPKRCRASDAELVAEGPDACPRRSVVGDGLFQGKLGSASVEGELTLLNNRDEIISVIDSNLGRLVARTPVEGRRIIFEVDSGVTIRRVRLEVDRISRDGDAYLRTPRSCPSDGSWTNTERFRFRDGVTETDRRTPSCEGSRA